MLDGGLCSKQHAGLPYRQEGDPTSAVQEGGWTAGPVWTGAENIAPPGFDPLPVQPIASGYTDCGNPAHYVVKDALSTATSYGMDGPGI